MILSKGWMQSPYWMEMFVRNIGHWSSRMIFGTTSTCILPVSNCIVRCETYSAYICVYMDL